jgi:hypothetical protein
MNKILSIILCVLFTVFSLSPLFGTVLATDGVTYKDTQVWVNFWNNCLTGMWKWCFDYEKMVWIADSQDQRITPTSVAQDVLLSATYMVWTVLAAVIIYCWVMYILAARWWKNPDAYKKWLVSAMIWAVLVRWAYAIVRLIQYIAKW